jgi:hypothetical protein
MRDETKTDMEKTLSEKGISFSGKTMQEFEKAQREANRRLNEEYKNFTRSVW